MFNVRWTLAECEVMDGEELPHELARRPECQQVCDNCSDICLLHSVAPLPNQHPNQGCCR